MVEVELTRGFVALIDDEDAVIIMAHKWSATVKQGRRTYAQAYTKRNGKKTVMTMHRFLLNAQHGVDVDHINGNGLDNRRCNLRECTRSQNMQNRTHVNTNNKSGVVGVSFCSRKLKWVARISAGGKYLGLGYYYSKEEAVAARRCAELRYYGEFAPER